MKLLDPLAGKVYLSCHATDPINIPHSPRKHLAQLVCGYFCVRSISPMHCEFWPVILWLNIKKAKSKLLSNRTTPRTVREPILTWVCLQTMGTLVIVSIMDERAVTMTGEKEMGEKG
jgi:hypothetical protein